MVGDIKTEFVQLRDETSKIGVEVKRLVDEQKKLTEHVMFLQRKETFSRSAAAADKPSRPQESWLHWVGRKTYVISVYRYFSPSTNL